MQELKLDSGNKRDQSMEKGTEGKLCAVVGKKKIKFVLDDREITLFRFGDRKDQIEV